MQAKFAYTEKIRRFSDDSTNYLEENVATDENIDYDEQIKQKST